LRLLPPERKQIPRSPRRVAARRGRRSVASTTPCATTDSGDWIGKIFKNRIELTGSFTGARSGAPVSFLGADVDGGAARSPERGPTPLYTSGMRGEGGEKAGRPHGRVYAGLVLTMVFWGSAFATSKMLVLEVAPEVGAVLRFGFGSLLMMAILFRRSAKPIPARGDWGRLGVVALIGVTGSTPFSSAGFPLRPLRRGDDHPHNCPRLHRDGACSSSARGRFGRVAGLAVSLGGAALLLRGCLLHTRRGRRAGRGGTRARRAAMCWRRPPILFAPLSVRIGAMPTAAWTIFLGSLVLLLVSSPKLPPFRGGGSRAVSGSSWHTW